MMEENVLVKSSPVFIVSGTQKLSKKAKMKRE